MTENFNRKLLETSFEPAEKIAGNDDLLKQILLRLPGRSLLRFRSVSPHWRSLISSSEFRKLHSFRSSDVTDGIFLFRKSVKWCQLDYIRNLPERTSNVVFHLDRVLNFSEMTSKVPSNMRTFFESFPSVEPMSYSNGLLCLRLNLDNGEVFYCVYNPCTNRYTNIPQPDNVNDDEHIVSMNLAYDPNKSSNYKVVCIVKQRLGLFRFLTYSAETSIWKESVQVQQVGVRGDYCFAKGVFLNGAVHLVSKHEAFLCFDVDSERLRAMPSTSIPEGLNPRKIMYFGESAHRLYLIEGSSLRPTLLNVFELEKDYSKWLMKYVVDIDNLTRLFPLNIEPDSREINGYQFDVLCFMDGEKDGKAMLVLSFPERVIAYDMKSMKMKELLNVPQEEYLSAENWLVYNYKWYHAYKHVETLAIV